MEFLALVLAALIGGVLVEIYHRKHTAGTLYINDANQDEEPYIFLELDKDVYDLYLTDHITLRVNSKSNSHR
jgi:hypothetical protein